MDKASDRAKMKEVLAARDARLKALEETVQQQQSKIVALQQQINERPANSFPSHFAMHPSSADSNDKTAVAAAAIPMHCADLRYLGHTINGLYLIMGTEKVETVFCDFAAALPSDPSNKINFNITFPILPI